MDILYTVEEKYLQGIEELNYGELPKALHIFNEIINNDPQYARAYYQLGNFYYYQFKDYQTAGYYYKKCMEMEAAFPDVYVHYLKLLITLKMTKLIQHTAEKALLIPGVSKAQIYEFLGFYAEEHQDLQKAREYFKLAALATSCQTDHDLFQGHLKRITAKQTSNKRMVYAYQAGD